MGRIGHTLLRLAGCVAPVLWYFASLACDVPVFRYALERWEADPYEIIVFHSEPLTREQQAVLTMLEKRGQEGAANLAVESVNLAREVPQALRDLWDSQEHPTLPWMVVRYPKQSGIESAAWAGALNSEVVAALLESPARQEITRKLMRGDAVVWLLLEGLDNKDNEEMGRLVEVELRNLEKSLVLPELSPGNPPMHLDLPLKIAFSTVRIARSDPAERMLM